MTGLEFMNPREEINKRPLSVAVWAPGPGRRGAKGVSEVVFEGGEAMACQGGPGAR